MKKILSLVTAAAMLCALSLPAAAESTGTDQRLKTVTQTVKETLDLDTSAYTNFNGNLMENALAPVWSLNWSGAEQNLSISAGEDGRILSYYLSDDSYYQDQDLQDMTFPQGSREAAQKAAQAFLDRVLKKDLETASLEENDSPDALGRTSYSFSGNIQLNGVDSPLWVSLQVRASDNTIIRFTRDDLQSRYIGGVPSGQADVSGTAAGESLKGLLSLRLEYVLNEDGKTASLVYLPNNMDSYYVDAHTGELVNLTELQAKLYQNGTLGGKGAAESASPAADNGALTEAEQSGVEKLAGVLSKEDLDKKLRAIPELGLAGYTLAQASYFVKEKDTDSAQPPVSVSLTYGKQDADGALWRKSVSVDGRTGALKSLWSSIPWDENASRPVDEAAAQRKAEAFLKTYYGQDFSKYGLYQLNDNAGVVVEQRTTDQWQFIYAQQENGYFFPADQYQISISARDGSVSGLYRQKPDQTVTFDSPEGLVSAQEALTAWQSSYESQLSYLAVPVEIDLSQPEYQPLAALGQKWFYALKLGWQITQGTSASGVDAKTGKVIVTDTVPPADTTYSDLEGNWAKDQILRLNSYGIGYNGGRFRPSEGLRQKDMVALLLSVWGYRYDPAQLEGEKADDLYNTAYWRGLLTKAQRNDDKVLTRAEAVKMLLDGAGYSAAAGLRGIYQCAYTDAGSIPTEYYGYAALAQGLGMVRSNGAFAAGRSATRAEAAMMLYNLLNR